MHYFLDPDFDPKLGFLNESESQHAIKSMRIAVGDALEVGNGRGTVFRCLVSTIDKRLVQVKVVEPQSHALPEFRVSIALSPTKNASRYEWFLEKATELGVDEIIPLHSQRTERPRLNVDRASRIVLAAAKQSKRVFLPELHSLQKLEEVLEMQTDIRWIAHCDPNFSRTTITNLKHDVKKANILILIGPEGDFSPDEIEAATKSGFTGIDLGTNRLRTETAGVFVASFAALFRG